MVWFHGGTHLSGQGHSLIFDGTSLAQRGVLVITVNYRLGPLVSWHTPCSAKLQVRCFRSMIDGQSRCSGLIRDNVRSLGGDLKM